MGTHHKWLTKRTSAEYRQHYCGVRLMSTHNICCYGEMTTHKIHCNADNADHFTMDNAVDQWLPFCFIKIQNDTTKKIHLFSLIL